MEFQEVVRRRRMIRNYAEDPVDPDVIDRALANALHAPSAGFSQGWAFLRLDSRADVGRFWESTTDPGDLATPDAWLSGLMRAPVVVVPHSNRDAYLSRYAEPDKGWADLDEARWPVPFWHMDTAMAALLILQTAVDEGLGALFFGIPPDKTASFKAAFGVPEEYTPVGAITIGHRIRGEPGMAGSAAVRPRRGADEVVHHGTW